MDAPRPLPSNVRLALLPPADAVKVFTERKLLSPAFSWQDVWQEEHARSFTVAKMMRVDLLQTVYDALGQALAQGRTFKDFAADLTPVLARAGWWGRQEVVDPQTGEKRVAELGTPRRLALIYDVNLRQSYAAGRWARIERGRAVNPIVVYRTMRDERVRISHQPWNGVALPIDHPWWRTHYPPNGWRCRCTAYATDAKSLDRLRRAGVRIREDAPPEQLVEWVNRRTGAVERIPAGIDPGFAYNPGLVSRTGQAARLEAEHLDLLRRAIRSLAPPPPAPPQAPPIAPPPPPPPAVAPPAPPVQPGPVPPLASPGAAVPEWQDFRRLKDATDALAARFGHGIFRGTVGRSFGRKATAGELLDLVNLVGRELTRLHGLGYPGIAREVSLIDRYAGRGANGKAFLGTRGPGGRRLMSVNPKMSAQDFDWRNPHGQGFSAYAKDRSEDKRAQTWRHELGHTIEGPNLDARLARLNFTDGAGNPLPASEWARRNLSEYSSTNRHEFFAEAFSRYLAPNYRKGEFPADLEAILEDAAQRRLDG